MKKIKIIMIIVVLVILLLFGALIYIYNSEQTKQEEIEITKTNIDDEDKINEKIQVTDEGDFYTINNCIYNYLNVINKNNSAYYKKTDEGKRVLALDEEEIKTKVYNILSEKYIEDNDIKKESVFNYVDDINKDEIFVPLKMYVKKENNIEKYIVYGIVEDINNTFEKELYIYVNLDKNNKTFSVEPILNKVEKSINDINIENQCEKIEKNADNNVQDVNITKEYLCKEYLNTYKRLALAKPEFAYEYLDTEYKEKRFENVERFKKYVEDNKEEIKALVLNEFLVDEDKGEYVCKDKYENIYIFDAISIMNFKMKLDTYTIPSQEYIDTYTKATEEGKISLNTDKYIKMVNSRDFSGIYKLLEDSFKTSHNLSEDDFIKYMKEIYPKHYDYESESITKQGDVYIQKINITDITKKEDFKIEKTLMMQLKNNLEFKVSFNFIGF